MTDQRPEDTDHTMLPPDLLLIHQRLLADGERWRRRVPDGKGLARDVEKALTTMAATDADHAAMRQSDAGNFWQPPRWPPVAASRASTPPQIPPMRRYSQMKGSERIPMMMTRVRTGAAAAAAVVIVGLFALLLAHVAANRGTGGSNTNPLAPSAQVTPTLSPTLSPPSQGGQPVPLPVVAASDPHTLYKIVNGALERSTNGGATYATAGWPKSDMTSVDNSSVAVSPLDPKHVFVTLSGAKNGQGCEGPTSYPPTASLPGVLASGMGDCSEQFISTDGGATWNAVKLPVQGVLGSPSMMRLIPTQTQSNGYIFQAQGQRLYAAEATASQDGALLMAEGVRLVASDDGGATWKLADIGLPQSDRFVCDFAAAPASSMVYAMTSATSCGNEGAPIVSLWRSANGGASWSHVTDFSTGAEGGMVVSQQGALYTFLPQAATGNHSISVTNTPAAAMVSLDGGAHFASAPSAGLPAQANLTGPLTTLSDGSVVYLATDQSNVMQGALYRWRSGQGAWTKIAGPLSGVAASVTLTPANGHDILTIVDSSGKVRTYAVA